MKFDRQQWICKPHVDQDELNVHWGNCHPEPTLSLNVHWPLLITAHGMRQGNGFKNCSVIPNS